MISKDKPRYNFVERDRLIWENFNDLIIVAEPMQDFKIEYFNEDLFKNLLGYTKEDIMGKSFLKYIHPDDLLTYKDLNNKYTFDEQVRELRIISKNGNYIWFESIIKEFNNFKNQRKLFIILKDISRLKDLESKLKESENRFKKVINLVPEVRFGRVNLPEETKKTLNNSFELLNQNEAIFNAAIESLPFDFFIINKDGYYVKLNTTFKEKWGDVIGKRPEDILHDEVTLDVWKKNNRNAFSGDTIIGEINHKVNGNMRYFYNIIAPVYINNKIEYIQGINFDITDLKITGQKLKESEEKFRIIAEQAFMGIIILQDDLFKYFNGQFLKNSGYNSEEVKSWGYNEFNNLIHPEDKDFVLEQARKKQAGEKDVVPHYKYRIIRKDGEIRWIENFSKTINYKGRPADLLIQIDITDKIEAERKLKESEAKYYELFETLPNGVLLTDLNGNILECNSALEKITSYSQEEFVGKNFAELDLYQENALDILLKAYNYLLDNYALPHTEFPIKRKDNDIRWVQITSNLVDIKGEKFIIAVVHDITSQKQAEEALKRSEEKYRELLETTSLGVIEIDVVNGKMKYINPKLLEIIGYKKEELSENIFQNDIIYQEDLPKLLRTYTESELEFRINDKQGKEKLLAGKKIPHLNQEGEITSIIIWLEDITEKKMYEELIYELNINFLNFTADIRKNIELLLNTGLKLLNGVIILYIQEIKYDSQPRYQVITSENKFYIFEENEFFENLFINELFYEGHDFPQTFLDIDIKKYAKTDPFINKYKLKGCFGKIIKAHSSQKSAVAVFYKENPIIKGKEKLVMFLICDAIEIEQRRWQVQRDLEEQNITLNKINKLKTELFSRTSHELKTPLISIKGFTELLLTIHHNKFDPDVISILEEIKDGGKRLEKIINLLLESTKLEAGQLELNLSEEDLTFLIKFCVKELRGLASLRDQSISLDLHQKLNTMFDKERIYEVISNLIVNAIKYTPPGGHIQIKSEIKDKEYIISIQDNGIGFTEEEKRKVFKQFGKIERYGQGWDVSTEGSGLGLYITKKLIELHGGKIWLESKGRNKGSVFYFSIPKK
ncbi:MAG: PAS domain S-box protein [Promethearchaeota archaeon]